MVSPSKLFKAPPLALAGFLLKMAYLYIVFALRPAVTNLSLKTLIFHNFQGQKIKFHDFPGLENEILSFNDFPLTCWNPAPIAVGFILNQDSWFSALSLPNIRFFYIGSVIQKHELSANLWFKIFPIIFLAPSSCFLLR